MRNLILNFNKQFEIGLNSAKTAKLKKRKFKGVCVCGMGGSALPGDILAMLLKEEKISLPLIVQRSYFLGRQVKKGWLVICISYSGNTEETISCFKEAKKRNLQVAIITSGGKLKALAKNKVPLALIPKGYPPRMALGCQFAALAEILKQTGLISSKIVKEISNLKDSLRPKKLEKKGKLLANELIRKIILVYASNRLKHTARIWKIAFNENAKTPAFWNYFSELNHNEMIGFKKNKKSFYFIILKDEKDNPKIKKRMILTEKVLKSQGLQGIIIDFKGKTFLEKIFNSILLSCWTSFYLAKNYKIDPTSVKLIEDFKKQLANH